MLGVETGHGDAVVENLCDHRAEHAAEVAARDAPLLVGRCAEGDVSGGVRVWSVRVLSTRSENSGARKDRRRGMVSKTCILAPRSVNCSASSRPIKPPMMATFFTSAALALRTMPSSTVRRQQTQTDRRSAGCDDELIIGAGLLRVAVEVADGDGFLSAVDLRDLAVREDVDTTLFNICREQGDKIVCFADHVAGEVGQTTGAAADVVGALKDRDVEPTDQDAWL